MSAMPFMRSIQEHRGHGPLLQVATVAASMAKISPSILTGPSRKVATRLSTVSCTRHPHLLWKTRPRRWAFPALKAPRHPEVAWWTMRQVGVALT